MARVRLTIPCPYCGTWLYLDVEQLQGKGWADIGKVKCDGCDSRCAVSIKVNRSGKGRRLKEREAKQREIFEAKKAEAELYNAAVLEGWKALDGCQCWKPWDHNPNGRPRAYVIVTNGIPGPPRHRHDCPQRTSPPAADEGW